MHIVWAISQLSGGGAEHVLFQLANFFQKNGWQNEIVATNQQGKVINTKGLESGIKVFSIDKVKTGFYFPQKLWAFACKFFEKLNVPIPLWIQEKAFSSLYIDEIRWCTDFLYQRKDAIVVSFLHPTDQIMMIASRATGNKIIVSERADPKRYFKKRYTELFLKKYYPHINSMVFQTDVAFSSYPDVVQKNGIIIENPVPSDLPSPYFGKRRKTVVNFCRLTPQKNIPLLIDAFDRFHELHGDYQLHIYGDGELKEQLLDYISTKNSSSSISILPFSNKVHDLINDCAMFVSSSDYEGMSNSMLEAMAIGLPTVCTDCPIGGAAYIIKDHENGILVPINDAELLANAMAEIADDENLSIKLSENGLKIRSVLDISVIGKKWMNLIEKIMQ